MRSAADASDNCNCSEGSVAVFVTEPVALLFMVTTAIAVWFTARRGGMPCEG